MENSNRSSESDFVNFFKGLDENYQRYVIENMQKKPPNPQSAAQADMAESEGDPKLSIKS
ncbi:hypothetical protein [Enterococcus devriesei]|uniref:hypothetical protein n=1 Tax=Enterococcus devriesei TaxID=319970 RepID=UPI0028ABCB64|nr:hypothetical protein [Enterococcus devriesei]